MIVEKVRGFFKERWFDILVSSLVITYTVLCLVIIFRGPTTPH